MSATAANIYQAHLDTVSEALWAHDFGTLLEYIHFPSFIETDDKMLRIDTPEGYLPSLHSFRRKLETLGATAYHRLCREAVFANDDPNRIEGVHETFALSGATPVMTPYLNQMTLIKIEGRWRGAGIRSATSNALWQIIKQPNSDTKPQA